MIASIRKKTELKWKFRWLACAPTVIAGGFLIARFASSRRGKDARQPMRRWVLGRHKREVAARFGAPRTAMIHAVAVTNLRRRDSSDQSYFDSDTWYYPMNSSEQTAMAISFVNGVARRVEMIRG